MTSARVLLLVSGVALTVACQSAEEKARAGFHTRLSAPSPLSAADVTMLVEESTRATTGRVARVQDGATSRQLDEQGRAALFGVLTGDIAALDDAGLRAAGGVTLRGLKAPGTPVQSEIEAIQTLWIDVDTFLPRRFELTYGMPGFGDYGVDLIFDR